MISVKCDPIWSGVQALSLTASKVVYILKTSSPSSICLCVFTTSNGVVINAANCQTTKFIFTNWTQAKE